jgi:transposase-like protein
MGPERFTPEFKQEAVRQVTERGYSVAEVAARVGVSTHCHNAMYRGSVLAQRPSYLT